MSGVLGDRDPLDVVAALRRLADIDQAKRRHPSAIPSHSIARR
jgi:hypothetical protein